MSDFDVYAELKSAREHLCRVQPHLDAGDRDLVQGALIRIALVEIDLPVGGQHQEALRRTIDKDVTR